MNFLSKLFSKSPQSGKPIAVDDTTFETEVLQSDLPAVVDFWSRTCAPCQVMGGLLNELAPEFAGHVRIFKLNVEEGYETAEQYRIRGVPTVIFFKQGREVDRVVGLIPLNPLRQKIESLTK